MDGERYNSESLTAPFTMSAEQKPERRHLIVGEETKDVPLGARIVASDTVMDFTVQSVEETGKLNVRIRDTITGEESVAPMPVGIPVIIEY